MRSITKENLMTPDEEVAAILKNAQEPEESTSDEEVAALLKAIEAQDWSKTTASGLWGMDQKVSNEARPVNETTRGIPSTGVAIEPTEAQRPRPMQNPVTDMPEEHGAEKEPVE